jgi:nucleotide-binding universal stress UspA family protein
MNTISPTPTAPEQHLGCDGICKNCGKAHIKVYGYRDAAMKSLSEHVRQALSIFPMEHRFVEVSEPSALQTSGATRFPALVLDGMLVLEGDATSPEAVADLFRNRYLLHSKLHRLGKMLVPVDMSPAAANALRFAWQIAGQCGTQVEVLYAMDSIFEGHYPSASGFLGSYTKTMKQELDDFVRDSLKPLGVQWTGQSGPPGGPGAEQAPGTVHLPIGTTVAYGFPDKVIEDASERADIIVMGTTGRGNLSGKVFGSVSAEVSKSAHCPVLFVPQQAVFQDFKHILYASNFDSLDALRIRQAIAFAQRFDSQLHFVHVGLGEKSTELERKLFEINYEAAQPDKAFRFSCIPNEGNVTGALQEYAFYHRIGLMVFVTRHRRFWENLLHQSISQQALFSGDLPVLVIHADDDLF